MIECRGVRARVGNFALRDISFIVPTGSHAILAGPTASGKTTLLELITGAIIPTAGTVLVNGVDVTSTVPESRGVGLVPQHGYLFPHLNVRQNIEYGAHDTATVSSLARGFGVEHLMARSVASLSGGERQLVALCRALASRRSVLLLDEPLSALDTGRRGAALRELAALQALWSFTVLHATHQDDNAGPGSVRFEINDGMITRC